VGPTPSLRSANSISGHITIATAQRSPRGQTQSEMKARHDQNCRRNEKPRADGDQS
jgi:hypothetical protein